MSKRATIALVCTVCALIDCSLLAQGGGTIVFNNHITGGTIPVNFPIYDTDGITPLAGPRFVTDLYVGPVGQDPTNFPLVARTPFLTGGYFNGGTNQVLGFPPGTTANVQLRSWDFAYSTFDDANTNGRAGTSPVFTVELGGFAGGVIHPDQGGFGIMDQGSSYDLGGMVSLSRGVPLRIPYTANGGSPGGTLCAINVLDPGAYIYLSSNHSGQILVTTKPASSEVALRVAEGLHPSRPGTDVVPCTKALAGQEGTIKFSFQTNSLYTVFVGVSGSTSSQVDVTITYLTSLDVTLSQSKVTISWQGAGTLQSTTGPGGNWSDVAGVTGTSYTTSPLGTPTFFRLRE